MTEVEYAPRGLFGILTPQANTTVEPELALMLPPGHAWINARLTSSDPTIEGRLRAYFDLFETAAAQFANAPVTALGFACTGTSYLVGPEAEDTALARLEQARGVPVVTAASAMCDALAALSARRVVLISPYHASLTEASARYWSARGFEVVASLSAYRDSGSFHPIYSLPSDAARAVLDEMADTDADAVVLLGTGMPTLRPIRDVGFLGDAPVLSCMLCLGWRLVAHARGIAPQAEDLRDWVRATHWGPRLDAAMAKSG